jgi:hypothetical protein
MFCGRKRPFLLTSTPSRLPRKKEQTRFSLTLRAASNSRFLLQCRRHYRPFLFCSHIILYFSANTIASWPPMPGSLSRPHVLNPTLGPRPALPPHRFTIRFASSLLPKDIAAQTPRPGRNALPSGAPGPNPANGRSPPCGPRRSHTASLDLLTRLFPPDVGTVLTLLPHPVAVFHASGTHLITHVTPAIFQPDIHPPLGICTWGPSPTFSLRL